MSTCVENLDSWLRLAITTGDIQKTTQLLNNGADVNATQQRVWGLSPLHIAVGIARNPEIVRLLIAHGADVNATDGKRSVLSFARENGTPEICEILESSGAIESR